MKSVQESKNELEAAVRYAENAISSAKQTIESMEFRQEMAKKQHDEQAGREAALNDRLMIATKEIEEQKSEIEALEAENAKLRKDKERLTGLEIQLRDKIRELKDDKEASSGPCGCQACRDLEEKVGDLKEDMKDQRNFDQEVRDAVEEFIEQLGTIGFEGA